MDDGRRCALTSALFRASNDTLGLPNMRLKLAGGDRPNGIGVFAPWRARTGVPHPCSGGRVARSLSAIR